LWFTQQFGIGQLGTAGFTDYQVPTTYSAPSGITSGPRGLDALWFTEWRAGKIGRITTAGVITEFPLANASAEPLGITLGSDGALWFSEQNARNIGRITSSGAITEFPATANSSSYWITAGPDDALWFTDNGTNSIGRMSTSGAVSEYLVPKANSDMNWITRGPDGALWFAENEGNKIGRITTAGVITEYPVPTPGGGPQAISTGPDGALWFSEQYSGKIGRITTSGLITEFLVAAGSEPLGITAGPDHALWFTLYNTNAIAKAPACALGLSASFAGNTLTTNFDLGIAQAAVFSILADSTVLLKEKTGRVVPPTESSMSFGPFPNKGNVTVISTLSTAEGQPLCSEWTTVNTE
jgi:virginiamycin B lyase